MKPVYRSNNTQISSSKITKRFSKMRITDSSKPENSQDTPLPPRPPKYSNAATENPGHNYLNLDGATESSKPITPPTPAQLGPSTDSITLVSSRHVPAKNHATVPKIEDNIFRYDFDHNGRLDNPCLTTLSSSLNKDNASDIVPPTPPPLIYRELKPGRKISDSNLSIESSPNSIKKDARVVEHLEPPSIDRKLKPPINKPSEDGKYNIF